MKTKQTLMAALVAVASVTTGAQAQCLTDAQAADLVANYVAKTPAANPENLTDADGACTRGKVCLLYTSPSPRDKRQSRMPSSA